MRDPVNAPEKTVWDKILFSAHHRPDGILHLKSPFDPTGAEITGGKILDAATDSVKTYDSMDAFAGYESERKLLASDTIYESQENRIWWNPMTDAELGAGNQDSVIAIGLSSAQLGDLVLPDSYWDKSNGVETKECSYAEGGVPFFLFGQRANEARCKRHDQQCWITCHRRVEVARWRLLPRNISRNGYFWMVSHDIYCQDS